MADIFHNEELLGLVIEYVHPHEMLSVVLTSQFFYSVCDMFRLTDKLTTSVKGFSVQLLVYSGFLLVGVLHVVFQEFR